MANNVLVHVLCKKTQLVSERRALHGGRGRNVQMSTALFSWLHPALISDMFPIGQIGPKWDKSGTVSDIFDEPKWTENIS